jgi:ribose 5-phosphate isomerase B
MTIYLAADHGGYRLKEEIKKHLQEACHNVVDCGNDQLESGDDYPDFILKAAQLVARNPESRGIVVGGSGQGEVMAANRLKNVRCMLFYGLMKPTEAIDVSGTRSEDPFEILRTSRIHNDSNMLSLGARFLKTDDALKAVQVWIDTPFTQEERHVRRIAKFNQLGA